MYVFKLGEEYLQEREMLGHTGNRVFINWTKNINEASTFAWINADLKRRMRDVGAVDVKVQVTRTVQEIQT